MLGMPLSLSKGRKPQIVMVSPTRKPGKMIPGVVETCLQKEVTHTARARGFRLLPEVSPSRRRRR